MMRKFAIFLLCIFSVSHALAAESPGIMIGDSSINPGSTLALPITIEGAGEIAGGSLKLSFNPEFISVRSVASGDFGNPTYNIGSGFVSISFATANAIGKSNATLAVVTIKGEKTGSTSIRIDKAELSKEDGSLITPSVLSGTITVEGLPETTSSEGAPAAQSMPAPQINRSAEKLQVTEKLESILFQLISVNNPQEFARTHNLYMRNGNVRAVVELTSETATLPDYVVEETRYKKNVQVLVPIEKLVVLSEETNVIFIRAPLKPYADAPVTTGQTLPKSGFNTAIPFIFFIALIFLIKKYRSDKIVKK